MQAGATLPARGRQNETQANEKQTPGQPDVGGGGSGSWLQPKTLGGISVWSMFGRCLIAVFYSVLFCFCFLSEQHNKLLEVFRLLSPFSFYVIEHTFEAQTHFLSI